MRLNWQMFSVVAFSLAVALAAAEEPAPSAGYVPDPELEQLIAAALDKDKAVSFPAVKRLTELGSASERALNHKLVAEKVSANRRALAEVLARSGIGRVGYRVTLNLSAEGSGSLILESDRSMLADCARKYDRLLGRPLTVFDDDELRRNPYSKVELAKHMGENMKYIQGQSREQDGRFISGGELSFGSFDDFASFATAFDRSGYHMLNGISMSDDNGGLRTLHFKKNAETSRERAANYLLLFHDVKWEFILNYKGPVQGHNAAKAKDGQMLWRFDCAQMLAGEAKIEVTFDPKMGAVTPQAVAQGNTTPPAAPGEPVAIVAKKSMNVALGVRFEKGTPNPNGPETEVLLDGRGSQPQSPELKYQWMQTSGLSLKLLKEQLAVPLIKMRIYEPGEYRFELTVSLDGKVSAPAETVVYVGIGSQSVAEENSGNTSSTQKAYELPTKRGPVVNRKPKAPETEESNPDSASSVAHGAPAGATGQIVLTNGIALDDIRREEQEFYGRVARQKGGAPSVDTNIEIPKEVAVKPPQPPPAQAVQEKPVAAAPIVSARTAESLPPPPPVPVLPPGTAVATTGRVALDDIRKEEDEYIKARQTPKEPPPEVPKTPIKTQQIPTNDNSEKIAFAVKGGESKQIKVMPPVEEQKAAPPVPIVNKVEKTVDTAVAEVKKTGDDELKKFQTQLNNNTQKPIVVKETVTPVQETVVKVAPVDIKPAVREVAKPPAPEVAKPAAPEAVKTAPAPVVALSKDPLQQGIQLMKAGQNKAAVDVLTKAVELDGKNADLKLQLAIAMVEASEKPDGYDRVGTMAALDKLTEILGENNKNVKAIMYAGHCNARLDRVQDASGFYRMGYELAKEVYWETKWQSANKRLKGKDFASALDILQQAETSANTAGIKDYRLQRDLAAAYHGMNKDEDAAKSVNAMWELGYMPDAALVAELKKSVPALVKVPDSGVAAPVVPTVSTPEIKPVAVDIKAPQPAKVVDDSKSPEKPVATVPNVNLDTTQKPGVTAVEIKKPVEAVKTPGGNGDPAVVKSVEPKEGAKPVDPAKITTPKQTVDDLKNIKSENITATPREKPAPKKPEENLAPEPVQPSKPLPPVPAKFEDALAKGQGAIQRGLALMQQNTEKSKKEAGEAWDEAEAMLRGAWKKNPGNQLVKDQFEVLAKQVGVIALVINDHPRAKANGLVVLSAESSIGASKNATMYYAWEQVDGRDLQLRRDELAKKIVGLRIKDPGLYTFELVVSDGNRGGNPVRVTVEVQE